MHNDVRNRLREQLKKLKVDAYIAYTPANLFYTTGFRSPLLEQSWIMMGTDMAIIPVDASKEAAVIVSDFMEEDARAAVDLNDIQTYRLWVECREIDIITGGVMDYTGQQRPRRPAQYDNKEIHTIIRDIIKDRCLNNATIGTDLKYIKRETFNWLKEFNPKCTFVDITDLMYELRMIKYPQELDNLRRAVTLSEAGVRYAISKIQEGQSSDEIRYNYTRGVFEEVLESPNLGKCEGTWAWISVGSNKGNGVKPGDLIKIDCGAIVNGYYCDWGRTFCFAEPNNIQKKIFNALISGHAQARELMRPGVKISDIFQAIIDEVRKNGLINYARGHTGHSIGIEAHMEEPPFISAEEHRVLQPGMVMCLETPYYAKSIGSFIIEDMIVITQKGYENLNTFSHDLIEL